jgi:hypothetical protein
MVDLAPMKNSKATNKTRIYQFCAECGKKINKPVPSMFENGNKFCEECEIGDLEGKCSCSQ